MYADKSTSPLRVNSTILLLLPLLLSTPHNSYVPAPKTWLSISLVAFPWLSVFTIMVFNSELPLRSKCWVNLLFGLKPDHFTPKVVPHEPEEGLTDTLGLINCWRDAPISTHPATSPRATFIMNCVISIRLLVMLQIQLTLPILLDMLAISVVLNPSLSLSDK